MSAPNHEPIDFSSLPNVEPRSGSYEEMLARRAARTASESKIAPLPAKVHPSVRPYWASAIAAMLVLGIGLGSWYGLREQASPVPAQLAALSSSATQSSEAATISDSASLAEAVEWYGDLGAGSSAEPLQVADAMYDAF